MSANPDGRPSLPPSIYPEATRHLPGNAAKAELPSLTGVQPETTAGADRRVHERVQSLRFYVFFTLVYGILAVLVCTLGKHALNEGAFFVSIPEVLQRVGLPAAVLPILCAPVFLTGKRLRIVKTALALQMIGYTAVFVAAFGQIVTNFANFFFGVGLVAVVQVFLWLWTRSVLSDVRGLRESS